MVQDYIKELNALHDIVKAVNGEQEVGINGEVFTEAERMFQSQHGILPMDPRLMEQYTTELSSYNNKLMLAIIALRGTLPSKYKLLKAELQNQYNLGQNLYPDTLISVTKVL